MTTLYGTFPLLVPGSTESQSVYGLKKTSGTILFKPGEEDAALTLAEQNGSVFPDPQVRTTDMGLLEMSFDAYTDTGQPTWVFGIEVQNLSKSFSETVIEQIGNNTEGAPVTYNWTITEIWITDSYTLRKVLASNLGSIYLSAATVKLSQRMLKRIITGKRLGSGANNLTLTWTSQVSSVTRRNFGSLDEVDIVSSLKAEIV
jgi:hypothetical protein